MSAYSRYTKTQNETASKERVMVLLFEKALRQMRMGAAHYDAKKNRDAVYAVTNACDIIHHLRITLDHERAPRLCGDLEAVYTFCESRLLAAVANASPRAVREAEKAFTPLVAAFQKAVAQTMQEEQSFKSAAGGR